MASLSVPSEAKGMLDAAGLDEQALDGLPVRLSATGFGVLVREFVRADVVAAIAKRKGKKRAQEVPPAAKAYRPQGVW